MEAVARGELTSERWIVHKLGNNEFSSEGSCQSLTNFGGNAGWHADPIGTSFFRLQTSGIDSSHVVDWARNNHEQFLIEPDLPIQVQKTSNDPSLWRLYGLNNYGQSGGTTDADLDAPEAWEITTGSRDVVIGVIDSGVDINHPDLAANIWVNPGETPNNGIDDDGNGFIDDVNGWDFYDDDNTPNDGNGHGTHVAGTIGAVGNNSLGITGVNWEVSILPLRFLGDDGSGWTSDAVAAVNYATMLKRDFGINVVATNNSWGGGGYSRTLDRAIESANDQGIMFVAAAGNEGNNNDTNPRYPTNYDAPNVISVAALNRNDNLAGFSNYGATTVDVGAPGVSIYSTLPGNSYGSFSGTSMAAPHVAGVVGLLNAAKPGISVTEVSNAILSTVDTLQSLDGKTVSGGRVNAAAALTSILGQAPTIDPLDDLILSSGQTQSITVAAYDLDSEIDLAVNVTELTTNESPASITLDGSTLTVTSIPGVSGALEVTVIATDLDQNSAFESFTVEVLEPIESKGSVVLNRDASGKFYANNLPIRSPAGTQISTSHAAGWRTLAAETINGVNNVLWEYTPTGKISYWNTDESWSWTSSFGEYYDGSTDYYTAETRFGIDINQDGAVGRPEQELIAVESKGSVVLNRDASGKFYANNLPIRSPAGTQISTSHAAGWRTLAAETINGVNNVLWEYTPTGKISYWNTDESWSWTSSFGEYYDGSTDYYTAETRFGIDINQDGAVGRPEQELIAVESKGSVVLNRDASGKFYANNLPIRSPAGTQISTSHAAGWRTLAAETINGVNNVLWEYTPTGKISYWNTDESWSWTSSFGEYYDGSTDYYTAETRFGIDINQDGAVGRPEQEFTAVESKGSVVLNRDASGKFYANNLPIRSPAGTQVSTSHAAGWRTLAAETINAVNNVLWEYTPTGKLSYWNTDESWSFTSSFGEYYDGSSDYYTAETRFENRYQPGWGCRQTRTRAHCS
jgi:subtilisin family serine protease